MRIPYRGGQRDARASLLREGATTLTYPAPACRATPRAAAAISSGSPR